MQITTHHQLNFELKKDSLVIASSIDQLNTLKLKEEEISYIQKKLTAEKNIIVLNQYSHHIYILIVKDKNTIHQTLESIRISGDKFSGSIRENQITNLQIIDLSKKADYTLALTEGLLLSNYQFIKYKSEKDKQNKEIENIDIYCCDSIETRINKLTTCIEGTHKARNLVNEPASYLSAENLSKELQIMAEEAGYKLEVFNKKKIESLKMGGLLAVNKGSIDPPTFNLLEWQPVNAINRKPYILVGKGIVFDTGGLNLKTGNFMDGMKSDMAGAAAVAGTIYAIAKAKLPIYVIGLIPATDNRPNGNAHVPGDVIEMFNHKTVEILNTDAEGRLILADALSYASKFNPELVIDIATLTGAAARAIGKYGIVAMGNSESEISLLKESGNAVCERIVEFPFWEEYDELIKSEIADIKNIGGIEGGAITAGKFLEHFTNYPWIHLDIAGCAYTDSKFNYRGLGGTGVGVRLFFEFLSNKLKK